LERKSLKHAVNSYILKALKARGALVFTLIDSENITLSRVGPLAVSLVKAGADAILVGGSTAVDQLTLCSIVERIKKDVTIPVILFPGNVTGVSPNADAILFSSLLNSTDPYFITGAQALGSLLVKKYKIEALPTGYIIAGEGGAAGFVGRVQPFPCNKPELVALYALAAQYLGMRFVYLEAGSGANSAVPTETIRTVRKLYEGVLIVGGGIRNEQTAASAIEAGADIIVIGNLIETPDFEMTLEQISRAAHYKGQSS
jgi:phosphoglycerol geranylgeranyltransferase